MQKATVLKDFPISYDGIRAIPAVAGSVIDVPDDLVSGLVAEKYIEIGAAQTVLKVAEDTVSETVNEAETNVQTVAETTGEPVAETTSEVEAAVDEVAPVTLSGKRKFNKA